MGNLINSIGERWLQIYSTLEYGLWEYKDGVLKSENNIVISPEEIDDKIKEYEHFLQISNASSEYYEMLEVLKKIKQKINP
jgi:hypothetical protein